MLFCVCPKQYELYRSQNNKSEETHVQLFLTLLVQLHVAEI